MVLTALGAALVGRGSGFLIVTSRSRSRGLSTLLSGLDGVNLALGKLYIVLAIGRTRKK